MSSFEHNFTLNPAILYACSDQITNPISASAYQQDFLVQEKETSVLPVSSPEFSCELCREKFSSQILLTKHEKVHKMKKRHKCKDCPESFNVLDNFILHVATHKPPPVKCPRCQLMFSRTSSIRGHIECHFKSEYFSCSKCDEIFVYEVDFKKHCSQDHNMDSAVEGSESEKSQCILCSKYFSTKSSLTRHLRIHRGLKPFPCDLCKKSFSQKSSLDVHMLTHSKEKPHQCPKCSMSFRQKVNLQVHMDRAHNSEPDSKFLCPHCSCKFKKAGALTRHLSDVHSEEKKASQPEKTVDSRKERFIQYREAKDDGSIVQHTIKEISVDNRKSYVCNFCSKRSKDIPNWLRHKRRHMKPSPKEDSTTTNPESQKQSSEQSKNLTIYQCSRCPMSFLQRIQFTKHLTQHQGELSLEKMFKVISNSDSLRRYHCSYCPMEFLRNSHLKEHIQRHLGVKPFHCPVCGKSFSSKAILEVHSRTHRTGYAQRPFQCSLCNKGFTTPSGCKRHLEVHNTEKKYECQFCGKKIKTYESFKKHSMIHDATIVQIEQPRDNVSRTTTGEVPSFFNSLPSGENDFQQGGIFFNDYQQQQHQPPVLEPSYSLPSSDPVDNFPGMDFPQLSNNQQPHYIVILDDQKYGTCDNFSSQPLNAQTIPEAPPEFVKLNPDHLLNDLSMDEGETTTIFSWTPQKKGKPELAEEEEVILPDDIVDPPLPPLEPFSDPPEPEMERKKSRKGEKNIRTCPHCFRTFLKPIDLKRHMRTHTGERPFQCDVCNKSFSLECTLKTHKNIHLKNKPQYTCLICFKDFSSKENLKVHSSVHTGEKPYECLYCDRHFRTVSSRRAHHAVHQKKLNNMIKEEAPEQLLGLSPLPPLVPISSKKGFSCKICKTIFPKASQRDKHESTHSSSSFLCERCSTTFSSKSVFTRHQKACNP